MWTGVIFLHQSEQVHDSIVFCNFSPSPWHADMWQVGVYGFAFLLAEFPMLDDFPNRTNAGGIQMAQFDVRQL